MAVVLAYGGGTNSTALCIEAVKRGLPIDLIVFADTGRRDAEMPETYRYIDQFSDWLVRHGYPPITVVRSATMGGETLEENCLRMGRLPSKAYGFKSCSDRWKVRPCWAEIKRLGMDGGIYIRGIDADESHRCRRADPKPGWSACFALVDWMLGRQECADVIVGVGLPLPGKSACFYCPAGGPSEVADLWETHPPMFERGLMIEAVAKANGGLRGRVRGLGLDFGWGEVDRSMRRQEALPWSRGSEDSCGCYDGARRADIALAPDYCGTFDVQIEVGPGGEWPLARDWRRSTGPGRQQSLFGTD